MDAGRSWSKLMVSPSLDDVPAIALGVPPAFAVDGVVYGATDEILLKSEDEGLTWSIVDRPIRYEDWRGEDHGPIRFEDNWKRQTGQQFSASTQAVADEPGAIAMLNFVGRQITWIGERGPDAGQAKVLVDGDVAAYVDLYSAQRETRSAILDLSELESGPHDILIEVIERQNPAAEGHRVTVDGFDETGF